MEQDKNKAPVDREEKPKAKRGTCRKPAAKKKAEKPAADTDAPAKESPEAPAPEAPEPAQTDTTNAPAAETAEPAQAKADDTDKTPDTATAEAEGADQMPDAAPADTAAEASDPAALDKCAFNESPDKDTPEQRERTASISRTAQLSIAQIMAGLEDNPQPVPALPADADTDSLPADTGDTDDAEDEPEDTISQKLRRGAFGMAKWLLLVVLFILIIAGGGVAGG